MAVLVVLVAHGLVGTDVDKAGAVGVTLFFVLSGFLITRLLIEERWRTGTVDLRRFYLRRARRLLPALVGAMAVCSVANAVLGWPILRPIVATVTYSVNFWSTSESLGTFNHLWSLAVEEHFYLAWPLVMCLAPIRLIPWIAGAGLLASSAARILVASEAHAYGWSHYRADAILLGALMAFGVARIDRPSRRTVLLSASVLLAFMPNLMWSTLLSWGITSVALGSAVLVASGLGDMKPRPILERLGVVSYGAYLFHFPLMRLVSNDLATPWWITLPVTVIGGIMMAELSWRLIERRFQRPGGRTIRAQVEPRSAAPP